LCDEVAWAEDPLDPEVGIREVPEGVQRLPIANERLCSTEANGPVPAVRDAAGVLPWLALPKVDAAVSWRLEGTLFYGGKQVEWSWSAKGADPVEVVLPAEAYFDGYQRDWLSRVTVRIVGQDVEGRPVSEATSEELFVVWPDGETPLWLDTTAAALEAPNGAWYPHGADAIVAALATGMDPRAVLEPPTGGAK
jgi:hypothetical protein